MNKSKLEAWVEKNQRLWDEACPKPVNDWEEYKTKQKEFRANAPLFHSQAIKVIRELMGKLEKVTSTLYDCTGQQAADIARQALDLDPERL